MYLDRDFLLDKANAIAPYILGLTLNRKFPNGDILSYQIIEVEAYSTDDPACHAYKGRTPRTEVMFGIPGIAYVYMIYGMYYCLNIVCEPEHSPGAVLIRALDNPLANGPGKLCKALSITKEFNKIDLLNPLSNLWLSQEADYEYKFNCIEQSSRIGIKSGLDKPWRFFYKNHPNVSFVKGIKSNNLVIP